MRQPTLEPSSPLFNDTLVIDSPIASQSLESPDSLLRQRMTDDFTSRELTEVLCVSFVVDVEMSQYDSVKILRPMPEASHRARNLFPR